MGQIFSLPNLPQASRPPKNLYHRLATLLFTIHLGGDFVGDVTVHYLTGDGTAVDPDDYYGASGFATFYADQPNREYVVETTTIDDEEYEGTENLSGKS